MSAFSRAVAAPLRAWSADGLRRMCACVDAALAAWSAAWGMDLSGEGTSCVVPGRQADPARSVLLGRRGESAAWLLDRADILSCIHLRLFGCTPSCGTIAEEVALSCRRDLLGRLRGTLGLGDAEVAEELPVDARRPWSGWILARLPLEIDLMMSPQAVQPMLGEGAGPLSQKASAEAQPLVPLGAALATAAFQLHAELEGCELGIDVLQDLQPGDVLRLRHPLDAPALVCSDGGGILFSGFLVRRGARRALELAPHPHGEEP